MNTPHPGNIPVSSFQFNHLADLDVGGHDGLFSRDPIPIFLQETVVNSSGMAKEVHSLAFFIQRFLC